ncbi:MAG: ABC transporter permease [Syntrophomonadaceae bacterium]|nr:ABC transporter permease [Syntrophomonadaceae bacterium]MDD3022818.1 ABC transporter permease [Syntrophomonadaceae bacterium]
MKVIRDEWKHITSGNFIKLMLIVPLLVAALFSYIFQNGIMQDAPLAVIDLDHSIYSRQLIDKLNSSQYIEVMEVFDNYVRSDMLLYNERYSGVLYLPTGLEKAYTQGKTINLGLYLDATMAAGASTIRSGISEVIGTENAMKGASAVLSLEQRSLYNPTNQAIMSYVMLFINVVMLGLIAFNTLPIAPRLRQEGKLTDDLKNPAVILFRTIPYALISCVSFYIVIGVLKQAGNLRFEANFFELFVPLYLYGTCTCLLSIALGWTAATPAKSTGRIVWLLTPSFLLSGVLVPYSLLPTLLQWIFQVLPLSVQFKIMRGMGYKGGALQYFMPELGHYLLIIALFMTIILVMAIRESKDTRTQGDVFVVSSVESP